MSGTARKYALTALAASAVVPSLALAPIISAQPTDPAAQPAFGPCDWVTVAEASDILGKLVFPTPSDNQVGSNAPRCFYAVTGDQTGLGISSELLLPGASPLDANSRLANAAAEPGAAAVDGLGLNAVCVFEPNVTPPSTTIVVLLDGGRVFRSTAAYEYCDTVERFARTAIDRINA
jgi:hypothetical protein